MVGSHPLNGVDTPIQALWVWRGVHLLRGQKGRPVTAENRKHEENPVASTMNFQATNPRATISTPTGRSNRPASTPNNTRLVGRKRAGLEVIVVMPNARAHSRRPTDAQHAQRVSPRRRVQRDGWTIYSWKRDETACPTASSLSLHSHFIRDRFFSTASTFTCENISLPWS